ncbi:M10 family metallopeptidase C-terminal domain-containing protein [Niveispirillum sp. BGYR6]|uniref:M10 family metallopeptidase C-terminal domain-containing protein n=1 Tax=Niveispirillum sp. BGYR6 TaxID=2971249 RepID=UPI0022B94EC5|nr:M10 family metallopeptidase C-terminal domain-containing protein [Niveispirillum sp. BGYR6]MDG5495317.1 M10 family metallopeptidase C-terminal domain-containing protein [Niveispirillum sp. BGYR6]
MCVLCGIPGETHAVTAAELAAAAAGGSKPVWTDRQIVDQLVYMNGLWSSGARIAFSFPTSKPASAVGADYTGFNSFSPAQQETARLALSLWSDVTRLNFVETTSISGVDGRISFANSNTIENGVWGFAFTDGVNRPVWVNQAPNDSWNAAPGQYDLLALIHEIGHTLSLSHPGAYNASDNGSISYTANAEFQQDSLQYTVMSYFGARNTGASHAGNYASTPLLYDVLAVQDAYGRNYTTRSGNTTYGFNSTADRQAFNFSQNSTPVVTIWDGGGWNRLDLSGYSMALSVDLRPGSFSDVAGLTRNLSIAYGTFMQEAVGGSAADQFTDNALANLLSGGDGDDVFTLRAGGNDTVNGGAGNDTLVLLGRRADYLVNANADGSLSLLGPTGNLLVSNVEQFSFAGGGDSLTRDQLAGSGFNGLFYLASNPDLIALFGDNLAAAEQHWLTVGRQEGRSLTRFDALSYLASNKDLIAAYGKDFTAATLHYIRYGWSEGRKTDGFDGLAYIASDPVRMDTIGLSVRGGMLDYVSDGYAKGAGISFNPLSYIASYADLSAAFGPNADAGMQHYFSFGYPEERRVWFDPLAYTASYADLIQAFGADDTLAAQHYIRFGRAEGREVGFDPYSYALSNPDLVRVYGIDARAWTAHYLSLGYAEGRATHLLDVVGVAMSMGVSGTSGQDWREKLVRQAASGATMTDNYATEGTPQAHLLTHNQLHRDSLFNASDMDWYLFRADARTSLTLKVDLVGGTGAGNALVELRDEKNDVIVSTALRNGHATIDFYTQKAEEVYVSIKANNAYVGTYEVTVAQTANDVAASPAAPGAAAALPETDWGLLIM